MIASERIGLNAVRDVLNDAKIIAVLGVSTNPEKPAHYVPDYLYQHAYKVIPVNASMVGETLFTERIRSSLAEITEDVDIVNIFRRADHLMDHLDDILAMNSRPKLVWLQQGICNDAFTKVLLEAGIEVVQDRCVMADHRQLGL